MNYKCRVKPLNLHEIFKNMHAMRLSLLFVTISTLVITSCSQSKKQYILEGEVVGYEDGTNVLVQTFSFKNNFPITEDTLVVTNGRVSQTYAVPEKAEMRLLRVENEKLSVIYFPEDVDLTVYIDKDSPQTSRVEGGKQNKRYNDYVAKNNEFLEKRQSLIARYQQAQSEGDTEILALLQSEQLNNMASETDYRREFMKSDSGSIFGVMVLSGMVKAKEIPSKDALKYLDNLDSHLSQLPNVPELRQELETLKKTDIGAKAPEFSGPTPDGDVLALSDALGKYTIIDFWASWCKPCRDENPNVVKAYKKYHDKGLNIISVSLDKEGEKDKWIKAIENDEMDWYHVSNLKFWQEPMIKDYNIQAIPATFLLDENGVIIDKNLRGEALQVKLATLFKE